MSNVVYYAKQTLPIDYTWKCSKCGRVNSESAVLQSKQESYSPGRKIDPQEKTMVGAQASAEMMGFLEVLSGRRGWFDDYRKMGLHPRCGGCRKKEPWSRVNLTWLNWFLLKAGLFIFAFDVLALLLGLLLWISNGTAGSFFVPLGIGVFLVGLYYAVKYLDEAMEKKIDDQLADLPAYAFPVLVVDGKSVIEFEEENSSNNENLSGETPLKTTKQVFENSAEDDSKYIGGSLSPRFCRNCGAKLNPNAKYCLNCGTKTVVINRESPVERSVAEASVETKPNTPDPALLRLDLQDKNLPPLLRRAFLFIEDGDWSKADEYLEKVLDEDPENGYAYLGKILVEQKLEKVESLTRVPPQAKTSKNYEKLVRFADDKLKTFLAACDPEKSEKEPEVAQEQKNDPTSKEAVVPVLLENGNEECPLCGEKQRPERNVCMNCGIPFKREIFTQTKERPKKKL